MLHPQGRKPPASVLMLTKSRMLSGDVASCHRSEADRGRNERPTCAGETCGERAHILVDGDARQDGARRGGDPGDGAAFELLDEWRGDDHDENGRSAGSSGVSHNGAKSAAELAFGVDHGSCERSQPGAEDQIGR